MRKMLLLRNWGIVMRILLRIRAVIVIVLECQVAAGRNWVDMILRRDGEDRSGDFDDLWLLLYNIYSEKGVSFEIIVV